MSKFTTPSPSSPIRAVIYLRVSGRGQEANLSLLTQEKEARTHAATRGYEVIAVERDVHTGKDLFGRPGLERVRAMMKAGAVDVLVAHALDRLGRKQIHLGLIFSEADHHGVTVEFVTEELEDTPEGRLLQSVRAYAAEIERLKIRERTGRGRRARATEQGRPIPGARPPYGYSWVHAVNPVTQKPIRCIQLVANPDTAPVIRRIFREAEAGKPLRAIVRGLTADGIPTATGKAVWCITTLQGLLANETYTGRAVAFKRTVDRSLGMKHKRTGDPIKTRVSWLPEGDRVPLPEGTVEQLITPEQFAAVRERLARNKLEAPRNNKDPEATLLRSGFIYCADCQTALRVASDRDRPPSYIHGETERDRWGCGNRRVTAKEADARAWNHVKEIVTRPDLVRRWHRIKIAAGTDLAADLEGHDRRLAEIATRQAKIARAVALLDDADAAAPLVADARLLAQERRDLEAEREEVARRAQAWQGEVARWDVMADWCETVEGNLETLTYQERRDLMTLLGVRVTVYRAGERDPRVEVETDLGRILYESTACTGHNVSLILRASDLAALAAD